MPHETFMGGGSGSACGAYATAASLTDAVPPQSRGAGRDFTESRMNDVLYIAGTLAFFGLMLGYVAACARLGRAEPVKERGDDTR